MSTGVRGDREKLTNNRIFQTFYAPISDHSKLLLFRSLLTRNSTEKCFKHTTLNYLTNLAQVKHGGMTKMSGEKGAHDPPGLLAVLLNIDHSAKGADEAR